MAPNEVNLSGNQPSEVAGASKVKPSRKYERFGETIRYLTLDELHLFLDSIEDYRDKLMMQVIYELGCRVGEFVKIRLLHLDPSRSTVFFPAENTKTRHRRTSHLPRGLMNEVVSLFPGKCWILFALMVWP